MVFPIGSKIKSMHLSFTGLADPYVKGQMGPYRFKTNIQKKTLTPKWQEEFKIPIRTWEPPNVLELEIRDKDLILDDTLGFVTLYFLHYILNVWQIFVFVILDSIHI